MLETNATAQAFVRYAIERGALRFGEFTLKSGRKSPYFFNSGAFDDGISAAFLADCYTDTILRSGVEFDMIYGPAYNGIPLATGIAIEFKQRCRNLPFAFNRKEAKDHGEGGAVIGAPLRGRVLIVDDVITAGTSVRESVKIIKDAGATPAGVVISLDRQERGKTELSAIQEVKATFGIEVYAVVSLSDVIRYLELNNGDGGYHEDGTMVAIRAYREKYGV